MSAVFESGSCTAPARAWPLLTDGSETRVVAWRNGQAVSAADFLADVQRIVERLPSGGHAINLCEDRYAFIASFCAVACHGHTTLLPPSRAPQAVDEAIATHPDAYILSDVALDPEPPCLILLPELLGAADHSQPEMPFIDGAQTVAIGFTSGSTGQPKPNAKTWDNFRLGTELNVRALREVLDCAEIASGHIVATVPAQHMYGMEMSVLMPLFGPFAVHSGKPFFTADIADALAEVPAPRLLVTTPVHLRSMLRENIALPPIAAIISATAPLPVELAIEAESRYSTKLIEVFGSTETCVIASRQPAVDLDWRLHDAVELRPQPDGTLVSAAHLSKPVQLQDVVELIEEQKFRLCGRNADLLEIAGKRASLADLTRRVLALEGVLDAVVFQLDPDPGSGVQRIVALVVAPTRREFDLAAELRRAIDPVFMPRPLKCVERLPRNDTGKLPRSALLKVLATKAE